MFETPDELAELQALLDASLPRSTQHLRNIVTPNRTLTAEQLVTILTGMRTLAVATVTAKGEPRISGADGHFLHGRWNFSTSERAAKVTHLRKRPGVSASHILGDDLGVFCHGTVEFLDRDHPDFDALHDHLTAHYGSDPDSWQEDPIAYMRIQPSWMVGYAHDPAGITAKATTG
jgi:Pyridoxamine 5'-phosphate oxidase